MGYKRITPERIESYRHMYYDLGWSMTKIADHYKLSTSSVQEVMKKNGLAPSIPLNSGTVRNYKGTPITGCWLWTGWTDKDGYGKTTWEGKRIIIHRAAYEAFNGSIPKGFNICHSCDTPACYRPDHLFIGTQKDNIHDIVGKDRWRGNTKLTSEQVENILNWNQTDAISLADLADSYGITRRHANKIRQKHGIKSEYLSEDGLKQILEWKSSYYNDGSLSSLAISLGVSPGHASNLRRKYRR